MKLSDVGAIRLVSSSKGAAVLLALLGVLVLKLAHIDPADFIKLAIVLVPAYVVGTAYEDGAAKLAQRPHAPAQSNTTIFPAAAAPTVAPVDRERVTPPDGYPPVRMPRDLGELDELELQSLRPSSSVRKP